MKGEKGDPGDTSTVWEPGDIKVVARAVAPAGWLQCDGCAVSRTAYAALFAAIGTTWGEGDGATTFNLPDYRDRVVLGASATRPVGTSGGEETHTLTVDEMPAHRHGLNYLSGTTGPYVGAQGVKRGENPNPTSFTGNTGGGQAHNNMQPFAAAQVLIKT